MMNFIMDSVTNSWLLLKQASPFFLFGLLLAGLLKMIMPPQKVAKHLGSRGLASVIKAAIVGIPLPLCSCSVLPVAASLKKQGAERGAVAAFLVSTPESGIDSIAISWALLDPIMTFARPIAAFFSAAVAGLLQNAVPDSVSVLQPVDSGGCSCSCSCSSRTSNTCVSETPKGIYKGLIGAFVRAVLEIWDDLAAWFFVGLLIAGMIAGIVPSDFFSSHLGGGIFSMLLMLVVGIPIYICATASTPVAAAMILKGMSPGTALVFLMVGPATNITSIAVLLRILGRHGTAVYLMSIGACSMVCGLILDWLYGFWNIEPSAIIGKAAQMVPEPVMTASALILIGSFAFLRFKKIINRQNIFS